MELAGSLIFQLTKYSTATIICLSSRHSYKFAVSCDFAHSSEQYTKNNSFQATWYPRVQRHIRESRQV